MKKRYVEAIKYLNSHCGKGKQFIKTHVKDVAREFIFL